MALQNILQDSGISTARFEQVHGGDTSTGYCLYSTDAKYFLKVNDAKRYPGMFEKEAAGLDALREVTPVIVPRVIKSGITNQEQWLLLEWIEKGVPAEGFWQNFGAGLAVLHQEKQQHFGWREDNFIGSLFQNNHQQHSWHIFFVECRILPPVMKLFNRGSFNKQDLAATEIFCNRIEQYFPAEPPALLHGDLWGGNFMVTENGAASIFDPAVYCGHREMDIGMTKLFGGFHPQFYGAYNEVYPLETGWQQRLPVTQLYPLLVHAVLFGGHYLGTVKEILKKY